MGSPKALLACQGETFLDRLIGILATCCRPVIVVLGHEAETIRAGLSRAGQATFVVNENYQDGQLSSLQCGLAAVPAEPDGCCSRRSITRQSRRPPSRRSPRPLRAAPERWSYPGFGAGTATRLLRARADPRIPGSGGDSQAREVIHRHSSQTCYVDVDDPGILADVDDPEAYRSLIQSPERP